MSAAVLAGLLAAGVQVVAEGDRVRLREPRPGLLRAEHATAVRAMKPALLMLAAGRWRSEVDGWPEWRRDVWAERAAIRWADGGMAPEAAEQAAYLEASELPEPSSSPELPPGTDPDRNEALAFESGAIGEFGSLRPGPCPSCGTLTIAVTGLGFCGCGWVRMPPPLSPEAIARLPPPRTPAVVPPPARQPAKVIPLASRRAPAPPPVTLSPAASATLARVLAWAQEELGATLVEVRPIRKPDPEPATEHAPDDGAELEPGAPIEAAPSAAPPAPVGLPPFDWASVVPLPPVRAPRPGPYVWPNPLDPPGKNSRSGA